MRIPIAPLAMVPRRRRESGDLIVAEGSTHVKVSSPFASTVDAVPRQRPMA
jgi:hypothetical protein